MKYLLLKKKKIYFNNIGILQIFTDILINYIYIQKRQAFTQLISKLWQIDISFFTIAKPSV